MQISKVGVEGANEIVTECCPVLGSKPVGSQHSNDRKKQSVTYFAYTVIHSQIPVENASRDAEI